MQVRVALCGRCDYAQRIGNRSERHRVAQTEVITVDLTGDRRVARHSQPRHVVVADQVFGLDSGRFDSICRTSPKLAQTFMLVVANTPRPVSKVQPGLVHTGRVLP